MGAVPSMPNLLILYFDYLNENSLKPYLILTIKKVSNPEKTFLASFKQLFVYIPLFKKNEK